jgi:hypothetical protein
MGLKRVGMLLLGVGILAAVVLWILGDPTAAVGPGDCAGAHAPTVVGVGPGGFLVSNGCTTTDWAHPLLWGVLVAAVGVLVGGAGIARDYAARAP